MTNAGSAEPLCPYLY